VNISESDCERNGIKSASGAGDNFRRGVLTGVQLEEVALVDVAGHWQVLISIMRPLVSPGILTAALIGSWSEFLIAKTFLQNAVKVTAMVFSSSSLASTARPGGGIMAAAVIVDLPIVVHFVPLQQRFIERPLRRLR
jgi:ABC-type glycerol-3-phosphate transport system permease component